MESRINRVLYGENYRISILTPSLIRLEYSATGSFLDDRTQVVQNRNFPNCDFSVIDEEDNLEIITSELHLHYDKKQFSTNGLSITMMPDYTPYGNTWHFGDKVNTLKGTARTLDTADGEVPLEEGVIARCGYSTLDDSNSFVIMDNGEIRQHNNEIDLYFFGYQHHYLLALQDFYHLTGNTPLLPRFTLGNWWSRYWKYTEESYTKLLDTFDQKGIPFSIVILDMDWHLTAIPKRFGSSWTGYTWNRQFFPDPERLLQSVHNRGLKIGLNVHPAEGIRAFEYAYPAVAKKLNLDIEKEQSAAFDFTSKNFRDAYFKDVHHPIEKQGVDFWWIDWQQGSASKIKGLDPLWLLNHYHFLDSQKRHNGIGLILSRYAGPGSHRYPIGFSGDTVISWQSLKFQPYFTATASNIGFSWWSHDIGGHMAGYKDEELSLRWLQLGLYSPINRLHSSNSPFNSKEPWNFTSEIEKNMINVLRERQEFVPYLYTMNVRTNEDNIPLILPMYYLCPNSDESYDCRNEYLFGNQLFVAPITKPQSTKYRFAEQKVWFPEGNWYDFYTGWKYQGDTTLEIYRRINEIPVFAKEGAIVPLAKYDHSDNFGTALPQKIVWKVFLGQSNHFDLVEDIGNSRCISTLTLDWDNQRITLTQNGDKNIVPSNRVNIIQIMGLEIESEIKIDYGTSVQIEAAESNNKYIYQSIRKELVQRIKEPWIEYSLKEYISNKIDLDKNMATNVNILNERCDDFYKGMIYELLYIVNSAK